MRRLPSVVLLLALLHLPARSEAQLLSAGFGPAFPTGDFKSGFDPGTGISLFARVSVPVVPLLQVQFEVMHSSWELETGGVSRDLGVWQPGAVAVLHLIEVSSVRPFILGGLSFSRQKLSGGGLADDTAWRFGYQLGAGLDYRAGPITPFVELRWVSLDAPGSTRYTFVPLLLGVKIL